VKQARAFTVASLAQEWECSEGVIRKLVASGQLRSFRIDTLIRIPADEVERFECQNIASNDSAADMPSSIEATTGSDTGSGYMRPTGLARRRKLGKDGEKATVHRGPWVGS
jgi:hypothetical protein